MTTTACISGFNGQTGSYLTDRLLDKGYKVVGLKRRSSSPNNGRVEHILNHPNFEMVYGDLSDSSSLNSLICDFKPEFFYHCAALSDVGISYRVPEFTFDVIAGGTTRLLEAIRKFSPKTRFLHTATSELYGTTPPPHDENSAFNPVSPYAIAKQSAYQMTKLYRSSYGLFAVNSISHNHESERRGTNFVTRKITNAAARIKVGLQDELRLGLTHPKRDFSHADCIARGLILQLESDTPEEYVFSSGISTSVQEFLEKVFNKLDLNIEKYVKTNVSDFVRPSEVPHLRGNSQKAFEKLGWKNEISVDELISRMINNDLRLARQEKLLKDST